MERVSEHISYREATYSPTANRKGITNSPTDCQLNRMKELADSIFEPCRKHFNEPIYINSFFRSITLNSVIGGSTTSQHCAGEAFDIRFGHNSKYSNADLFYYIKNYLDFDQLIWEFGDDNEPAWIHCSYKKESNRKQVLKAKRIDGKVRYNTWI
jgi:zinc D-Ala-D-Ala carboxypeptidase